MLDNSIKRRNFLQVGAAAGLATVFAPSAFAAPRTRYDPAAKFDLTVSELEYRRTAKGRSLLARNDQPSGPGPFPVVLDLHGGAWNAKDRHAEEPFDRVLAAAGALVVAVDLHWRRKRPIPPACRMRVLPCAGSRPGRRPGVAMPPGPACSAVRAAAMSPNCWRCAPTMRAITQFLSSSAPGLTASMDYVLMRSPISNTFARFENAQARKVDSMIRNNRIFFVPWESIHRIQSAGDSGPQGNCDAKALSHHAGRSGHQYAPRFFSDQIRSKLSGGGRFL